ncbi:hypothetical protein [Rothia sp. P4278]|uniref:hypothetical protein n=1 Tax=Rothia sp. P4278 TaxID=3402658 RepID=UPI003AE08F6F
MNSTKKVLIPVVVVLAVIVVVLGVMVVQRLGAGKPDAFANASADRTASAVSSIVSSSPSGGGGSGIETYVLADGTCETADGVDKADPDAVATRFVEISYCFDSVVDSTMTAGMLRADGLMTDGLRSKLVEPERNALQNQWVEVGAHKAYTRPTVSDAPTEEMDYADEGVVHKSKMVQWLWVGRAGGSMDGGYATVNLLLVQQEDGSWLVDDVSTGVFEAK